MLLQQKSHSEWQTEISCLLWGRESDKNGCLHPLWVLCGHAQCPWDGGCGSPGTPQCRNAAAPAGLRDPRCPLGTERDEPPAPQWHGTAGSSAKCKRFNQHLVRGGNGNPQRGSCQNPWVQSSPSSRTGGSCRQNIVPYCSGPYLSVSAAPQLPMPLAFPLGESSRKRPSIAPVRGQWPWCGKEPQRHLLAFDSRGRKPRKSFKERTLHLNRQNCLPKVQENEKIFVE